MKKILIIPARRHIVEAYCEYLIRYLGNEFDIQMGYPTEGNNSPYAKNPDDFDLIYPHFDTHWFLNEEKYKHKIVNVQFETSTRYDTVAACTSDPVHNRMTKHNHHLRFGIDTNLFTSFPQPRQDNLLHVGFMGNIQTPRRYLKELFIEPLKDLEGVKLDIYPTSWASNVRVDEIEFMGGQVVLDNIVDGDKWLSGLPNLYNRMDVYVRTDIDHGYQLSVLEAAACGVPVICTDSGPSKEVTDAGGGICIGDPKNDWSEKSLKKYAKKVRNAVIWMRDHPNERLAMGLNGGQYIRHEYNWDKWIPKWREFFKEGLERAKV